MPFYLCFVIVVCIFMLAALWKCWKELRDKETQNIAVVILAVGLIVLLVEFLKNVIIPNLPLLELMLFNFLGKTGIINIA